MNLARTMMRALLGRRLPITSGRIELTHIDDDVVIHRDRYGIPHIEAKSEEDAWFAVGFCHGQDRGFQLEMLSRVVRGTVAALVGKDGLAIDRLSRRFGFWRNAGAQRSVIDEDIRAMAEAYARGVNAGRTRGARRVPHELALLRAGLTTFDVRDVLGVVALQGVTLTSWQSELVRLKVLTEDGIEALAAIDGAYADWHVVTNPPGTIAGRAIEGLQAEMRQLMELVGHGGGSNNWALAPSRTATGRPILANDTHLAPVSPPHWYLAHLRTPEHHAAGFGLVGMPGLLVGHNDVGAWGLTTTFADHADLAVEEIGSDGRSVRRGGAHVPCEVHRERIEVRNAEPVVEEVLVTPDGPIIGPALAGDVGAISMRATWLQPRKLRAALDFHRARSFDDVRRACRHWPTSGQNVVYADTSGNIAWQLAGDVPRRKRGQGAVPSAGFDASARWDGDVPFDELPHAVNPKTGWIATANNKPIVDREEPFLGIDWIDGYRITAIAEALDARSDWDVASTQALQMDVTSLPWREVRGVVLSVPTHDRDAEHALRLLESWDGHLTAESVAASVFEMFMVEMEERILRAKAPKSFAWAAGRGFSAITPLNYFWRTSHLVRLMRERPEGFFARGWVREIEYALAAAIRRLRERGGERAWAWGEVHSLTMRHALGKQKPLDRIFEIGPIPWGGDANTIAQAAWTTTEPAKPNIFVASMRMVVDVGDWSETRVSLPGGQSGNPLSPHFDDLLEHFVRGTGVPIAWTEQEVAAAKVDTLKLARAL